MKNYWPLGIFLLAMVVVGLIVLTLKMAISNPVELQGMCGFDSQFVDKNANEIAKKQKEFLQKYNAEFVSLGREVQKSKKGTQKILTEINKKEFGFLELKLSSIEKSADELLENAKVKFFLTRPHTTKEDRELGNGVLINGIWRSVDIRDLKNGRYEAQALIEVGADSLCLSKEYVVY